MTTATTTTTAVSTTTRKATKARVVFNGNSNSKMGIVVVHCESKLAIGERLFLWLFEL